MLEATPDSLKPSDFPVLLPIKTFQDNVQSKKSPPPQETGNIYLILGIGGLSLSALGIFNQREAIMAFLQRNPTLKSQPRPNLRYVDWNFNIIYTAMSDKLDKIVINTTVLYGLWRVHRDIMYPLNTVLVGYSFDLVKDIFITPGFDDDESDFDDVDPTEPSVEPG